MSNLPSVQVLEYKPELTHSVWVDFIHRSKSLFMLEERLLKMIRDGEIIGYRLIRIEKNQLGLPESSITAKGVAVWHVKLNTGDWFYVFARGPKQAFNIVREAHFPDVGIVRFRSKYEPRVERVADSRKISSGAGLKSLTAKRWANGKEPGIFVSNFASDSIHETSDR